MMWHKIFLLLLISNNASAYDLDNPWGIPNLSDINAKYISQAIKSGSILEDEAVAYVQKLHLQLSNGTYLVQLSDDKSIDDPQIPAALLALSSWNGLTDDILVGLLKYIQRRKDVGLVTPGQEKILKELRNRAEKANSVRGLQELNEHFPVAQTKINPEQVGVYQVSSIYNDEKPTKESGTSSVLEVPGQGKFLLTDAHLLGGKSPSVLVNDKEIALDLKKALINADQDLAMVPLPVDLPVAVRLNNSELIPSEETQRAVLSNSIDSDGFSYYKGNKYYPVYFDGRALGDRFAHYRWITPPWSRKVKDLDEKGDSAGSADDPPELVSDGAQVLVRRKTAPGMSGTLLIENIEDGAAKVKGMLSQYNIFFRDSYFASDRTIMELIDNYKKGQRGYTNATRWKYRNGLTYRDFGSGTVEVNFIDRASGNGVYVDPGDGVYVDPGNGVYVDPGCASKGSTLDVASTERIVALHQKVSGLVKTRHQALLDQFGISFGMQYEGKTVVGFEATSKKDPTRKMLLYANVEVLKFMQDHVEHFDFRAVEIGADLAPYALAKARGAFPKTSGKNNSQTLVMAEPNSVLDGQELHLSEKKISFRIPSGYNGALNEYAYIDVQLDAKGRSPAQKDFFPIVEAYEPKAKNHWFVDVRQLFFTDITDVAQRLDPNDRLPGSFFEALDAHNRHIGVKFHRVEDAYELTTSYITPSCFNDSKKDNKISYRFVGKYSGYNCQ